MPLSSLQPRMRVALELDMDYAKPADVVASMIDASFKKLALSPRDLLIRGALSGALLGAATALAFSGAITTGQPLVGALIFPVSLVMILLLGWPSSVYLLQQVRGRPLSASQLSLIALCFAGASGLSLAIWLASMPAACRARRLASSARSLDAWLLSAM